MRAYNQPTLKLNDPKEPFSKKSIKERIVKYYNYFQSVHYTEFPHTLLIIKKDV